ncbi:MAG: TetR/AcrR family transcriptional regulator [Aequorivita sp.]
MTTKQKIIDSSVKYFNQHGFTAVTLNEIAGHLEMTRGNLTYHYKTKDELLKAITDAMWKKIAAERAKSRALPSFENLHNEVQLYYRFQKEYAFIFLDSQVMKHPMVIKQFREMTKETILDNKKAIAFAISIGNMKPEPFKGAYHNISLLVWMIAFFWSAQQIIRGEQSKEDGEALIWSILLPHFTEKGKNSMIAFFGEEYLDNLGEAFNINIEKHISF